MGCGWKRGEEAIVGPQVDESFVDILKSSIAIYKSMAYFYPK